MTFLPAKHSHKERAVLSNGSTHRKHCSFIVPLCSTNANLSGRGPSICSRRPFGHLKAPLGFHCFANANFTYLDNGNVNFPDNKKYSRSKPTIIRIPPTTLMPIRLTLLFFIILFAKTNSSAPTTIIKTDINGYMSFLLSNSDLLVTNAVHPALHLRCPAIPAPVHWPARGWQRSWQSRKSPQPDGSPRPAPPCSW